jgi:drug/metabolite transporter (DMT)-like permease
MIKSLQTDIEWQGRQLGADAMILFNTIVWGLAYVVVKDAIGKVDYFVFLNQRFTLAFILTLPLCMLNRRSLDRHTIVNGLIMGVLLFGSYSMLTIGLQYTTATNSSFITSLHIVFVPILGALFFKESIAPQAVWGSLLCVAGLFLLCTRGDFSFGGFNVGELWIVSGALCIALRIIYTSRFVKLGNVYVLTAIQLGTVAFLTGLGVTTRGHSLIEWHPEIAWSLAFCAVLATVFAFTVLNSMQRFTTPTHVAVIFCMEPVFTAIFGYYWGKESMTVIGLAGAGLVLLGMFLSELPAAVLHERLMRRVLRRGKAQPSLN